jgi:anaerobic selenocysteine-containing dehydrogenase
MADTGRRTIHAVCPHDCPDTCAMLVDVDELGRVVRVRGDASHPFTHGGLCVKVAHYEKRTYHSDRLRFPMKRVGAKGAGRFERVSWDEALDTVAARLKAIAREEPQSILPYSYGGTMGLLNGASMDRRFFHRLGASLLDRTICASAGMFGMRYTVGASVGTNPETVDRAKFILVWGSNLITSNIHLWRYLLRARSKGARIVTIDPLRTRTAEQSDEHIPIMPGTDGALALGMMHVIIRDGLEDRDYIDRYTIGFDALRKRLDEYPPARVAQITSVPAETIERLAHEYAASQPSFIRLNYGLQRHAGGGMTVRTIFCMPALVGAWRHPGGGALLSTSGFFSRLKFDALERSDLIQGRPRTINMSRLGEALTQIDPPVRALIVYNSNPAVVAPNQQRVLAGLRREDLFTVVLEHFQTDTADYADIVLPATTQLEHTDIHKAYGHTYLMLNSPAIEPLGEAKPNTEIFRLLAARMGFNEACFLDSDEMMVKQALERTGIAFEDLKENGWVRLRIPDAPFAAGGFPSPTGKCELHSERMESVEHLDPVPTYTPPREDRLSNRDLAVRFPLVLISPPAHHFLNSTFVNIFQKEEMGPTLEIHPDDAAPRGITSGLPVQVYNERGDFTAKAVVTDRTRPGVLWAPSIWWNKLSPGGRNCNSTTSEEITDIGGGATFYDNLVEVRCAAD